MGTSALQAAHGVSVRIREAIRAEDAEAEPARPDLQGWTHGEITETESLDVLRDGLERGWPTPRAATASQCLSLGVDPKPAEFF